MYKYVFKIVVLAMALMLCGGSVCLGASTARPFTVVLDAGHGGSDSGARGRNCKEKDVVLNVALELGRLIQENHPEVKVLYTRSTDVFVTLDGRAEFANRNQADLFISIHANSVKRNQQSVQGAMVFTLGLHRTEDNLEQAMAENQVIELENDYSVTYSGFDPTSPESYIFFELAQNQNQQRSIEFAELAQRQLVTTAGRADRQVQQAGFLVLRRVTVCPSVLVELDFICNNRVAQFLGSRDGQNLCAKALSNAFTTYYSHHRSDRQTQPEGEPQQQPQVQQPAQAQPLEQVVSIPSTSQNASATVTYTVQFLTSEMPLNPDDPRFRGIDNVEVYFHKNLYKYVSGQFTTLRQAKRHLANIKKIYPEAFIIKMRNGVRVEQ